MKVLCNKRGAHDECRHCGASEPHDHTSCEPCPFFPEAECVTISTEPEPGAMSEDLAIGLAKGFEAVSQSLKLFNETSQGALKALTEYAIRMLEHQLEQAIVKWEAYIIKAASATFLTRWFWVRKRKKAINKVEELTDKLTKLILADAKVVKDILDDYSCGNCGWTGSCCDAELILDDPNNPEGDGVIVCPNCGSEQVGAISEEDFEPGCILFGCTWHGEIMYPKKQNNEA